MIIDFRDIEDIANHFIDGTIETWTVACEAMCHSLDCHVIVKTDPDLKQNLSIYIERALKVLQSIFPDKKEFTFDELLQALPFFNEVVTEKDIFIAAQDFLVDVNTGDGYKA